METIKDLVLPAKYSLKCPYTMAPEFIVIHNTSNDASAKSEVAYMKNNNCETSYHFAVDDVEIRQALPLDRNAWHAGDGANGKGNRKGIAIEICYSKSGGERFLKAEDNAAKLTAEIVRAYGWGIDKVKKHQDFSGKYCPHRTLDLGWQRFVDKIKKYMVENTTEEDVVEKLLNIGVITAKEYWLKKLKEDKNVFCMTTNWLKYMEKKENG